jgi:hypothetical protein
MSAGALIIPALVGAAGAALAIRMSRQRRVTPGSKQRLSGQGLTVALVFVLGILNVAGAIVLIAEGKAENSAMAGCFGLVMVAVSLVNHALSRRDESRE